MQLKFFKIFVRAVEIKHEIASTLRKLLNLADLNALNRPGRAQSLFRDLNINGDWNFERAIVVIPEFQISQEIDLKEEVCLKFNL